MMPEKAWRALRHRVFSLAIVCVAAQAQSWEPKSYADADLETPYRIEVVAENLRIPWSLALLPDGRLLISERQGRVRMVEDGVLKPEPVFETEVPRQSTNGVLGLAPHPDFIHNGHVYLAYNVWEGDRPSLKVVRFRLRDNRFVEPKVIIENLPAWHNHTGCRLLFGPDGKLYLTVGDANEPAKTQQLNLLNGKILRLNDDGSVPVDNPFAGTEGARPEIYSYGHRNSQGLAFRPGDGSLWSVEHGAGLRDELNRILPGRNYGWSVIEGVESAEGMESPALSMWGEPALAPGGMTFYRGDAFPELRGDALIAIMQGQGVMWAKIEGGRVSDARMLFRRRFGRIRDVAVDGDGSLYLATSMYDNRGLKLTPPPARFDMVLKIVPADRPKSGLPVLPADYSLDVPEDPRTILASKADKTTEELITQHCSSCHGEGLKGDLQSSLVDGQWKMAPDPNTQYYIIANGLADRSMPAFRQRLSPAQIYEIMRYILSHETKAK